LLVSSWRGSNIYPNIYTIRNSVFEYLICCWFPSILCSFEENTKFLSCILQDTNWCICKALLYAYDLGHTLIYKQCWFWRKVLFLIRFKSRNWLLYINKRLWN
jgi:hypothetical protein